MKKLAAALVFLIGEFQATGVAAAQATLPAKVCALFDRIRTVTGDSVEIANRKRQQILELITA